MTKQVRPAKRSTKSAPLTASGASVGQSEPKGMHPLPKTRLVAAPIPARIAAVSVQSAQYSERPNPKFVPEHLPAPAPMDLSVRAEYGWAGDSAIVLTVHVDAQTRKTPVLVDCNVTLRVAFEGSSSTSSSDLWTFVKEAGLRIAFPFVRTHIATLTAMGSLGSMILEPLVLGLEDAPTET